MLTPNDSNLGLGAAEADADDGANDTDDPNLGLGAAEADADDCANDSEGDDTEGFFSPAAFCREKTTPREIASASATAQMIAMITFVFLVHFDS